MIIFSHFMDKIIYQEYNKINGMELVKIKVISFMLNTDYNKHVSHYTVSLFLVFVLTFIFYLFV